ncbi:MAG: hypothetical protein K9L17_12545 [Clostridiales bacterium]|nr:hypothetical protein [Clostridiales bacterium]MCF8023511.1 hypothetical protein [Clostridiales bacterium]
MCAVSFFHGTTPHVVDPKNPGAVDEIVHLGDHWNEEGLVANKKEILAINKEVSRLFKRAYSYLGTAKVFLDEVKSYYRDTGALDVGTLDKKVLELTHRIFENKPRQTDSPRERHLFGTAITPKGTESHLDTIIKDMDKRYIIYGDDGTGKTTLVRRLTETALMRGYDIEAYHCALDPSLIDHLVIPGLGVAVINAVEPHYYPKQKEDISIDTMDFVNKSIDKKYLFEKNKARELYRVSMDQAIWFISQAKQKHDEMEKYYVPYMDFNAINSRREQIFQRILKLASQGAA